MTLRGTSGGLAFRSSVHLAAGGTQGGDPLKTALPARFEVDYMRVYQQSRPAD